MKRSSCWLFLGASLLACLVVFRGGMWGSSLLAPLDIAPTMFSKWHAVAPEAPSVPRNHYIIDQLTYDLPLQWTIYHAVRAGEIPWWDPYTYCGRPLLADAHVNGTDPFRLLCYLTLPFEWAYNWTRILHSLATGLGMFLLLRALGFTPCVNVLLALVWQFAGCQTVFFGHPWIQASFLYYPWLWLVWHRALERGLGQGAALGGLLTALVFYAGNLQSHAYWPVFALAWVLGYGWGNRAQWWRIAAMVGLSGVIGGLLAAPVLTGQLELYRLGVRTIDTLRHPLSWLGGLASLSAVFPWVLGTFRTLDLSKFCGQSALGFTCFIGSAALVLGLFGVRGKAGEDHWRGPRRTALFLVLAYVGILSTPLVYALYTRAAALGVMGLIVLTAIGAERLLAAPLPRPRWGWSLAGVLVAGLLAINFGAFVVYPKILPRLREAVLRRDAANTNLDSSPALREIQLTRFPGEVSVRNPQTLIAAASLLALAAAFIARDPGRARLAVRVALAGSVASTLVFSSQFIPHHPVSLWQSLLRGGPEQQRLARLAGGTQERVWEQVTRIHDYAMPHSLPHLFQVRTVHGYAALRPQCYFWLPKEDQGRHAGAVADFVYRSDQAGEAAGSLSTNALAGLARFQWNEVTNRSLTVERSSLNTVELKVGPGPAASLQWNDTWYPGWKCYANGLPHAVERAPGTFARLRIPEGEQVIRLEYRPTWLNFSLGAAGMGLLLMATTYTGCRGRCAMKSGPVAQTGVGVP